MANVLGCDVSRWNGKVDFSVMRTAGARFCFIRAGSIDNYSGVPYADVQFSRNKIEAPKHLFVGAYWYFRPNHDPVKQANYFADLLAGTTFILPDVVDIECDGSLPPAAVHDKLLSFADTLKARRRCSPIIYTRGAWWNENVASDPIFGELDLWVARYTQLAKPWGNAGDQSYLKPRDWTTWRFWQFSADGNGRGVEFGAPPPPEADNSMDLNYFHGELAAFYAYIGQPPELTDHEKVDRLWAAHPEIH